MEDSPVSKPPRLSAGVVVLRNTDDGLRFLLLRAFKNWDFPKGMVEEGETPLEGALREVKEESAIEELQFPWGEQYFETAPYSKNKVARYYLGVTQTEDVQLLANPELSRAEHTEYRWLSADEAYKLVTPRVALVLDWALRAIEAQPLTGANN